MNLDHLNYFVTTAETLHMAKAAKTLHIGQSTISHGIRKLEEEIGHELLEKRGKNIVLTEVGRSFAVKARDLLLQAKHLKQEFHSSKKELEGTYRIGATHGLCHLYLSPLLANLHRDHPRLVFEVYSLRSSQVVEGVAATTLDIGLCFSPTAHPHISELKRIQTPLNIAVKKNHPALKLKGQQLINELSRLSCASPKAFIGIEVCENHPALERAGIKSNVQFIFDSYEVAAHYLKKSSAWCLMPDNLIGDFGLDSLELPLKANAAISILHPRNQLLPAAIKDALENLI